MSIVADHIRRLDLQLDKIQLKGSVSTPSSPAILSSEAQHNAKAQRAPTSRQARLTTLIRALSTSASSHPQLQVKSLISLLSEVHAIQRQSSQEIEATQDVQDDLDLEWLVVGKATVQTYGLILNSLLDQILPLSDEIWYWDEVLGSYAYTALYALQTSPLRAWGQMREVYQDVKEQFGVETSSDNVNTRSSKTMRDRWSEFYDLVRRSIQKHSAANTKARILSPFARCRTEARQKQTGLKRLREMNASGLGLLMGEGLLFDLDVLDDVSAKTQDSSASDEWQSIVLKSIALMENVLRNVTALEVGTAEFEEVVFSAVEDDPDASRNRENGNTQTTVLIDKLQLILKDHMPIQLKSSQQRSKDYGRPSRLIRYWLPATALLLSSSTLLRVLANRRAEIITWVQEFGSTVVDFWVNWIIEPVKKLIGTIRHDENSEVAIMSKHSLEADRESLERMVVDFAIDNPIKGSKGSLSESDIATIRKSVKEGDLTPVLKAYERDLRSPFMGAVRGELVRALLIQIQKTKVDVEVAIGGIDALLKSQELVFGFVGLTPGVLVVIATFRWLGGVFGSRKGMRKNQNQSQMIRTLRNIDRILNNSAQSNNGMLSYKDHGLLLFEVQVLRQKALRVLPGEINREFLEEVGDLVDIQIGVIRQQKVVQRIRWAYAKWLY